jgi:hypothetical protein
LIQEAGYYALWQLNSSGVEVNQSIWILILRSNNAFRTGGIFISCVGILCFARMRRPYPNGDQFVLTRKTGYDFNFISGLSLEHAPENRSANHLPVYLLWCCQANFKGAILQNFADLGFGCPDMLLERLWQNLFCRNAYGISVDHAITLMKSEC